MTELRPFQLEGCRAIYNFGGRALLADDQGLGKTIQALYWIRKIPSRRPVVIVAPASMKWTWQVEAATHFGMRTEVLDGHRPKRVMKLPGEIVILNYDILASWLPALLANRPECVIFDECQYIKNPTAKRTRASIKLVEYATSVLGLSGTPIVNRPIEFWPILNILLPDLFSDRSEFAWEYCKPRYTPWGWQFDGATNMGKLHRILREECMIRRLKKDVLPELPSKSRRIVSFKLNRRDMEEYQHAQDHFLDWLKEKSPARAARAKRSPALTKVGYMLRLVAKLKLHWTERWIEEFLELHEDKKLVALTMHTFVVEAVHKRFPNCVVIDGSVTGRKRTDSVRLFQTNKRTRLLVGNWIAAGIGLTLTAAHNIASLDFPWTPGHLMQGEDRVYRIGQTEDVTIHYLVALGTIEEKLMKILRTKSEVLDSVLNGGDGANDLNILEDLLKEMKHNAKSIENLHHASR